MAERRMFSKRVTDTDVFLDMPLSAQALYFHLNMNADDDGFVDKVKKITRSIGCRDDDLKLLIAKQFIFGFDSGVVVISNWYIHNYIRKDRYHETLYTREKQQLSVDENGNYFKNSSLGQPVVNQRLPEVRLGKDIDNTPKPPEGDSKKSRKSKSGKITEKEKEDFEALWKLYPRKRGKNIAEKAYLKAIRDGVTNKTIQDGIIAYCKQINAEGKSMDWVSYGSTFFNQRMWDDDFTPAIPTQRNGKSVKQEPPMAKNEVPSGSEPVDMQSVKDMLKGIKTNG
ncbi:hypothetical protein [Fructobacillus fructosus]|uniref:hypothetical protein n=1 Tax=Fructobacillus fructosus TaxID=1631 RepID=UPI002DA120C0|nr:DNA replication protein DnaD (DnaD) [Fructobacillus fructosus]CAK1251121.1 DNA replication protein DnaD (DnaD) [Fructobacillus fructosus]CAK1252566.1 DNA replication protein DnaD (DnaD) [Fructobacillus fructosus]